MAANHTHPHLALAVIGLVLLNLAACDRRITDPAKPAVQSSTPIVPSLPDPSVPPAAAVVSPAITPTAQDSSSGRATGRLTPAQESTAMPMPGQVKNHSSTALDPAKRGGSSP